jgi:glycosyltransferase involved in cell wall biosynthesis
MQIERQEGGTRVRAGERSARPLVSIISVVFRDRDELRALIENLAPFRSSELEVVIVDGGSDDGSLDVLREHDASVDYWLSEPDRGVYDAMNKGLAAARGRWILHINAGDRLLFVPFERLRSLGDEADVLCCRVDCKHLMFIPRTNWTSRFQNTWQHQGTFYRLDAHEGYDTTYRVVGDFAANQRMIRQGRRAEISSDVVAEHFGGGLSDGNTWLHEESRSIRENFGRMHQIVHMTLFKPVRRVHRNLRMWLDRGKAASDETI